MTQFSEYYDARRKTMPEPKSPCFSDKDLRNYLTGWSQNEVATRIESHLEQCQACEATLVLLEQDSDTLIERLRGSETQKLADDSQIAKALSRSRGLVPVVRAAAHDPIPSELETVGSYELLRPIGSGGMGAVYLAKHRELGKTVAIKLVPTRLGQNDQRSERFLREMRAAGKLSHPAIVSATDAGREGNVHYLVMEHIDGFDLSRICRGKPPMAVADACELIRRTAIGLDYAHSEGVIHRDIKPSNLMLSRDGELKILDFGLARMGSWEEAPELTSVGQLMGTLDYMSPEQAEHPESVDYRADLYSLGATLFRLLTGRPPLAAAPDLSPLAKLKLLAEHQPPRLDTLRPDIPKELVDLVMEMLDRTPTARPPSASHVAEKLQPFCQGHLISTLAHNVVNTNDEVITPAHSVARSSDPARVPPRGPTSLRWIAAAMVPLFLLLGGWLTIETQKGQLVIQTDAENVTVQVLKDGKKHRKLKASRGTTTTRLFAGEYELRIEGPDTGLVINGQQVEIKRGATAVRELAPKRVPASTYLTSQSLLEPGHELEIKCLIDESNDGTFQVMADHTIKLRMVGVVSVKGETLQSLEKKLNTLYGEWYAAELIVEVFFSNSTLSEMVAVRENAAASESPSRVDVAQPVYNGQPLDFWLSTLKYEHQEEKLVEAVEALETLGKQTPERGAEVSAALLRTITKTNAFEQLAAINTPEQYTELVLECLRGDDQNARIRLLGTGLRSSKWTGLAGMRRIQEWIDESIFSIDASDTNKELIPASRHLFIRLAATGDPEIRDAAKATLRRATLEQPYVIPPSLWLNFERTVAYPFTQRLSLELCGQVIADPKVSEEQLTQALLHLRYAIESGDEDAIEQIKNFEAAFSEAIPRLLQRDLEVPGKRNAFVVIHDPPRHLDQLSFAARWHRWNGIRFQGLDQYESQRIYPRLQLCMLANDLGLSKTANVQPALASILAICQPAIDRLGEKDSDPKTLWRVFQALEDHRSKDKPNDYFDVLLAHEARLGMPDTTDQ
ncbi:MAG: serine/threonine-protein kinase [Planctomycetota bacterium]